jgi:hypothetical protein
MIGNAEGMFAGTAIADGEPSAIDEDEAVAAGGGEASVVDKVASAAAVVGGIAVADEVDIAEEESEENDSACVKPRAARMESRWAETSVATSSECGDESGF